MSTMRCPRQPFVIFGLGFLCFLVLKTGLLFSISYDEHVKRMTQQTSEETPKLVDSRGRKQWALPGRFGHDHKHEGAFAGASFSYVAHHVKGAPPDATDLLTHLKFRKNNTVLEISNLVGKKNQESQSRNGVYLTIGIVHTSKHKDLFMKYTLKSLLGNLTNEEAKGSLVVVLLCDLDQSYNTEMLNFIKANYAGQIDTGLLEVIVMPKEYYPDFATMASTANRGGESVESFTLRCKENLDTAFLMNYAQSKSKYFASFTDDVVLKPGYVSEISRFLAKPPRWNWYFIRFTSKDALSKNVLLRSDDVPKFVNFFLTFYRAWRLEQLYEDYLVVWCRRCSGKHFYLRLDFPSQILTTSS